MKDFWEWIGYHSKSYGHANTEQSDRNQGQNLNTETRSHGSHTEKTFGLERQTQKRTPGTIAQPPHY